VCLKGMCCSRPTMLFSSLMGRHSFEGPNTATEGQTAVWLACNLALGAFHHCNCIYRTSPDCGLQAAGDSFQQQLHKVTVCPHHLAPSVNQHTL
jgi:hypothetical protein